MDKTPPTLLLRIRNPDDAVAWTEFYAIYGPLVYRYAQVRGLSHADAEDVRSQCLHVVVETIGEFEYDRAKGGFKNWLRRIASNKIVDAHRKRREKRAESQDLREIVDDRLGPDELWDRHWHHEHLNYCVDQVRESVSPENYEAFRLLVFEERPVKEVCDRLGMNANQVYLAKSRVLDRVRKKMLELGTDEF